MIALASMSESRSRCKRGHRSAATVALWLAVYAFGLGCGPSKASARVAVASSVAHVVTGILGPDVELVAGASSSLARQIDAGLVLDAFVTADPRWLEWLVDNGHTPLERAVIATNALVVVAPSDTRLTPSPIAAAFQTWQPDRVLVADPRHVPLGRYTKAALESLDLWASVAPRLIRAADARAVTAAIERGAADVGIVYRTDHDASDRLVRLADIPSTAHPAIRYEAAAFTDHGRKLLSALKSSDASGRWQSAGFGRPSPMAQNPTVTK